MEKNIECAKSKKNIEEIIEYAKSKKDFELFNIPQSVHKQNPDIIRESWIKILNAVTK